MLRLARYAGGVPQVINNLQLDCIRDNEDLRYSLFYAGSQQRGTIKLVFQRLDMEHWLCDSGQV